MNGLYRTDIDLMPMFILHTNKYSSENEILDARRDD